jgi:hypothetical protein
MFFKLILNSSPPVILSQLLDQVHATMSGYSIDLELNFFKKKDFLLAYISCTGGLIVTFPNMLTMYLG